MSRRGLAARFLAIVAVVFALGLGPLSAAPSAVVTKIYPLGDSITYGATFFGATTPGGYRGYLDQLLTHDRVAHTFVGSSRANSSLQLETEGRAAHDGWPGFRVDQVADSLDGAPQGSGGRWLTGGSGRAAIFPDVAIVLLGANDIWQRFDPGVTYPTADGRANFDNPAQRALFVGHLAARLGALIDKLYVLRPEARIVVSDVLPFASSEGVGKADLATPAYATLIRNIVAVKRSAGRRVVFADVWTRFVTSTATPGLVVRPNLLAPDNVHPLPTGYQLMARVYRDAVTNALRLP